jgi:hypothetical protein
MRTIDCAHGKLQSEQTISSARLRVTWRTGLIAGFKARSGGPLLPFNVSTTAPKAVILEANNALVFSNHKARLSTDLKIVGINEILLAM